MSEIVCPVCGTNDAARRLWDLRDRLYPLDGLFPLSRCARCGLAYLDPPPDRATLSRHYPDTYYGPPSEADPFCYRWRCREIESVVPKGRLLDVGCGNGGFLAHMARRGWEVEGMDVSPRAVEVARSALGDRVRRAEWLDEAGFSQRHYDVVTLFEVLEHASDPRSYLIETHRLLKPGGLCFISVPNFSSWERLLFGPRWCGLDAPRHLFQFTPSTLRTLLARAGFVDIHIRAVNAREIQVRKNRFSYARDSLRHWLRDLGLYPPLTAPLLKEAPVPTPPRRSVLKTILQSAESIPTAVLWGIGRLAGRDNTLWVRAGRHADS